MSLVVCLLLPVLEPKAYRLPEAAVLRLPL